MGIHVKISMLYIHIPYCRRKCIYCDFFCGGVRIADWKRLISALLGELEERVAELPDIIPSVYFGGGTPSLMPPEFFLQLSAGLRRIVAAAGKALAEDCELTMEVNPEDVTPEKVAAWKEGRVNRISIGIQTFNDRLLGFLGRTHDADTALKAINYLTREFPNVSGDLMFGLPGQTMEMVRKDLETLIASGVKHISIYSLMYEEGTALTVLRDRGRIKEMPDETVEAEYNLISDTLRKAGFNHYEVSNYALPGFHSRHNSGYWRKLPYLGVGPSAHSYDGENIRRANPLDIKGYLERFGTDHKTARNPFYLEEILNREESREETLMLSLRTREGLDMEAYGKAYGRSERDRVMQIVIRLNKSASLFNTDESRSKISIREEFLMRLDSVIVCLL